MTEKMPENINTVNERGARRQLIEELFYDFNYSKTQVYWMNFTRGIFFGFGTVLGGTVLVALTVWILGQFVGFPVVGDYVKHVISAFHR